MFDQMNNLLQGNYIIKRALTENKPNLLTTNEFRKGTLKPICKNFGHNFVTNIAQRDRAIIRNKPGIVIFWNEGNISPTAGGWHNRIVKEISNSIKEMITNIWPEQAVKFCIKAIRTRGLTRGKIYNSSIDLIPSDFLSKDRAIRIIDSRKVIGKGIKNI